MPRPLVEEVPAEGHPVAHAPSEHIAHRPAGLVALEVEEGDLEWGVDGVDGGLHVEHASKAGAGPAGLPTEYVDDDSTKRREVKGVESGDRGGHGFEPGEVRLVGIRLT